MRFDKLLTLFTVSVLCFAASTLEAISYVRQWGTHGSGNGQFIDPIGVAVDSTGNVYVVDYGNARVQKFSFIGTYISQYGSGHLVNPNFIGIDASNNTYVTDTGSNMVVKFDASGNFLTQWPLSAGQGICVDSQGFVYGVDATHNQVVKFDSVGNIITQWGSTGTGPGQFTAPQGIAADTQNNIYVSDASNNNVQKFTSTGTFITSWGSFGSAPGLFNQPAGVASDIDDNIYVCDFTNHRIQVFTSNGTFITIFGTTFPGNITYPVGIAVSLQNNIYASNELLNSVYQYSVIPDPVLSSLVASPTTVPADGVTTSTLTATLLDVSTLPVYGKTVALAANGGQSVISAASGPSNKLGQVTFTVKDHNPEYVTYTATDTTDAIIINQKATVAFTTITPPTPPAGNALLPPSDFRGVVTTNEFATQKEYTNILTWAPSPDATVVGYKIFLEGNLIAEVGALGPYVLTFRDSNEGPNTYTIVAFNSSGVESDALFVILDSR